MKLVNLIGKKTLNVIRENFNLIIHMILVIIVLCMFLFLYLRLKEGFETNNTIYTYWHENPPPDIINKFISNWKKHNPSYKVVVLHDEVLKDYLPDTDFSWTDSHPRKSDLVRLEILAKYGGIWSDASILCNQNYDWISSLKTENEFVGYYLDSFTTNKKYPVIESWFFACRSDSTLVKKWRDEFKRIPTFPSVDAYIDHLEKVEKIDLQNIDAKNYLAIHCSLQKVLQTNPPFKMHVLKAEDGPYKPLTDTNWDSGKAIDNILKLKYQSEPIIKLRGGERGILIERSKSQNIDKIFN